MVSITKKKLESLAAKPPILENGRGWQHCCLAVTYTVVDRSSAIVTFSQLPIVLSGNHLISYLQIEFILSGVFLKVYKALFRLKNPISLFTKFYHLFTSPSHVIFLSTTSHMNQKHHNKTKRFASKFFFRNYPNAAPYSKHYKHGKHKKDQNIA